jgi:hypothetical protein
MKVYTEVVYTWDDTKNELVEESSKSFDYEGEVTQCWGGSFGSAVRSVSRQVKSAGTKIRKSVKATPAQAKAFSARLKRMRVNVHQATKVAAAKVQAGLTSASKTAQSAGATGLKKAQSNMGGLADAGKANLHAATDAGRTNLHTGADAGKAFATDLADKGKALWDQARGKGGKEEGGQAGGSQESIGSTGSTSEKSGKFGSKGQLSTAKRKKANTGKNKLKVRVA